MTTATPDAAKAAHYEQWMVTESAALIAGTNNSPGPLANSVLEAFLLHTRVLTDFYLGSGRPTDITAGGFLPGWVPTGLTYTRTIRDDLHKHLAHLTDRRLTLKPLWDVATIVTELRAEWGAFLDALQLQDPSRRKWFDDPDPANRLR